MALDYLGRPANPLDKYQSYSYHHILMVAANTQDLFNMQQADESGGFDTSRFENLSLSKPIPGTTKNNSSGIFVVSDTRKNSNFQIKSVNYSTALGVGDQVSASTIIGSLKMIIHDVNGITFLNYLQYLLDDQLNSDYLGLTWVLKTIFTGHEADGSTSTVSASEIPLILQTIQADFKEDGGHYSIEFASGSLGGPSQLKKANVIGQSSTHLKSDTNRTLESVIQDLQNHLNKESKDYYDKLKVFQLPPSDGNSTAANSTGSSQVGRLVQYMITIPEEWKLWPVDGVAKNHTETDWKKEVTKTEQDKQTDKNTTGNTSKALGSINVTLKPDMSVDSAIDEIFKHCDKVMELAAKSKRVNGNEIILPKVISSVTSDDKTMCLHWDVFEFKVPNVAKTNEDTPTNPKNFNIGDDGIKRPANSLEFDFLYSGKNADIIKFDMKLQDANVILLMARDKAMKSDTKGLQTQKNNPAAKATQEKENISYINKNTPIFIPIKTSDQLQAFSYIAPGSAQSEKVRQEYLSALASFYATSNISPSVIIRGNPSLLQFSSIKIAPHVKGSLAKDTNTKDNDGSQTEYRKHIDKYRNNSTLQNTSAPLIKHITSYPLLVKINIYRPDVDFDGKALGDDFAKKFWYDNYYRTITIDHNFNSDGSFTQELKMIASTAYEASATKEAKK